MVHFILPKEVGGVQFGGLERKVVFFDLDCRFDVLRLSQILTQRISEICGKYPLGCDFFLFMIILKKLTTFCLGSIGKISFDKLFCDCMNRFLYVRCYNSSEFLSSLKAGISFLIEFFVMLLSI